MPTLLALTAAAAWLLLGAGGLKIVNPDATGSAMRVLIGVGEEKLSARLLGVAEVAISLGFLIWPVPLTAASVGAAYLGVFGSAWILKQRDQDCGCFGASSTPVGPAHLIVTLVGAVSALGLALIGGFGPALETYVLIAAATPIAVGAYALIAPLTLLRTRLGDLKA